VIRTTPEHPFWVRGRGWVPAGELKLGELLSSHDGQWVAVEDLLDTGEWETVYNLRVADYHTYFVGSREWQFSAWAHNLYGGTVEQDAERLESTVRGRIEVENAASRNLRPEVSGERFTFKFSRDDMQLIVQEANARGLQPAEVEGMVLAASRTESRKSLTREELLGQMRDLSTAQGRDYPYLFESQAQFRDFSQQLVETLRDFEVPAGSEVVLQGSALRKQNANDLDIMVIGSREFFNEVRQAAAEEIRSNFASEPERMREELGHLNKMAADGRLNRATLDRWSGGYLDTMLQGLHPAGIDISLTHTEAGARYGRQALEPARTLGRT